MKYCSFSIEGQERFGFEIAPGCVVDLVEAGLDLLESGALPSATRDFFRASDLKDWFSLGTAARELSESMREILASQKSEATCGRYSRRSVRMLAPIGNPGKIIF